MPDSDIIDTTALAELMDMVGGDKDFLAELIDTYFEDTPQLLAGLRTAATTNNADDFRRNAHSLKSNSAGFGAMKLSNLCKQMEILGKAGDLSGTAVLIEQAQLEYEQVRQALLEIQNTR